MWRLRRFRRWGKWGGHERVGIRIGRGVAGGGHGWRDEECFKGGPRNCQESAKLPDRIAKHAKTEIVHWSMDLMPRIPSITKQSSNFLGILLYPITAIGIHTQHFYPLPVVKVPLSVRKWSLEKALDLPLVHPFSNFPKPFPHLFYLD